LARCAAPLAPFLARVAASGEAVARQLYGSAVAGAWMAHGFTDGWASAAPLAPPLWSLCTSCGAWASLQLFERFEYTAEASHLLEAWPLLRGAALFAEEGLRLASESDGGGEGGGEAGGGGGGGGGGRLRWGPSHSPENAYLDGHNGSATRILAYDVAIDLGVIAHLIRAVVVAVHFLEALGSLGPADRALGARMAALLPRLPGGGLPQLSSAGELTRTRTRARPLTRPAAALVGRRAR
jgi:alpha-L-fucosidase 2